MYVFQVNFTVKCKSGIFSKNEFKYSFPMVAESYDYIANDIFNLLQNFPWKKLEFESYTDPDIALIKEHISNSDQIKYDQLFEKKCKPTLDKMHKKNGTYQNDNSDNNGGGHRMHRGLKLAGLAAVGYAIGRSGITG